MSPIPSDQEKHQPSTSEGIDTGHEQIDQQFDLNPADIAAHTPSLRGRKLTAAVAFVAGTGFTLFGCVKKYLTIEILILRFKNLGMTKASCRR